jgi:hypothetical protein
MALGAMAWSLADVGSSERGLGATTVTTSATIAGPTPSRSTTASAADPTSSPVASSTSIAVRTLGWKLPAPLSGATVVVVDGQAVVLGGQLADGTANAAVVSIDLRTGATRSVAALPHAVADAAGAVIGTRIVVMGGRGETAVQAIERRATEKLTDLPTIRVGAGSATRGGEVFLVGGSDGSLPSRDVTVTTDGKTFRTIGELMVPVAYPAVALMDGELIVVGGETSGGADAVEVQSFDLANNTASVIGRLSRGVSHAAAAVINGELHLVGGRSGTTLLDTVDRLDLTTITLTTVARLPAPTSDGAVALLGDVAYLIGGNTRVPTDVVIEIRLANPPGPPVAAAAPFDGQLLIADRGNDRVVLVNADHQIVWESPSSGDGGELSPIAGVSDVMFARGATAILATSATQDTIAEISYPGGTAVWTYGRADRAGSGLGFLNEPRDAFRRTDGSVTVADTGNCRVVEINAKKIPTAQMGTVADCHAHEPPNKLAGPTSVTPLPSGNVLVAEVNSGTVNEMTRGGVRVWTAHPPIARPSEPRQIGDDRYLATDASRPGGVYAFDRAGQILFSYSPSSGAAMLDHPTQAAMLPSGMIVVSDSNRHRVVVIDPATSTIVWQYGELDVAGSGPNQLDVPGGFDLLATDGSTPLHPGTG